MDIICQEEAQAHYNAQQELSTTEAELAAVNTEIDDLIKLHAPHLLEERKVLEDDKKERAKIAKEAQAALTLALTDVARTMSDPYGKHKLFPYAVVENKTFVEIVDPVFAAMWYVARGMEDKITFSTTPIATFQNVPESELPRLQDGRGLAIKVYQAPHVKIDGFDKWENPAKEAEAEGG